jgi:hypothetical protein
MRDPKALAEIKFRKNHQASEQLTGIIHLDDGSNAVWNKMTQNLDFSNLDANEVELRGAIMLSEGIPIASLASNGGRAGVSGRRISY